MTEDKSVMVNFDMLVDCNNEVKQEPVDSDEDPANGFLTYQLKPDLFTAILECGFEYPSKVQHECIPLALRGIDILCHANPGMGKTAIFILSTLQLLDPVHNQISVLVLCHSRELAFEISKEYERFCKYIPSIKVDVFCGGRTVDHDEKVLQSNCPHVVVGTPGKILNLLDLKKINLNHVKHFILDEFEKLLGPQDMQRDIYEIFRSTPRVKQVMMFSAELYNENKLVWKKFVQDPVKIQADDMDKATFNVVWHYYVKLKDDELKRNKLFELLDVFEYNKIVIYTRTVQRCIELSELLAEHNLPVVAIHRGTPPQERMARYQQFKNSDPVILVATNFFGRGMYFEKVNIVIGYDTAEDPDTYMQRISRAGQFGAKRLALTFLSDEAGADTLNDVQHRFDVSIVELPEDIYELPKQIGISPCIER